MITLKQKLNSLISQLKATHADIIEALNEKGVVVEEIENNASIAPLIRKIFQSDWEFFFNFHEIDQFGQPRTLQSGQQTGGFTLFHPAFSTYTDDLHLIDVTHTYVPTCPLVGAYGHKFKLDVPIVSDMNEPVIEKMFDFKEEPVIGGTLHGYDTLS